MPLNVYGAHRVMENAAVELAVRELTGEDLHDGYIAHLVGGGPDLSAEAPGAVADVAMNADTQLLRYSVARPDIRLLFTATRGHYEILGRRSRGVVSPGDLRGKWIATFLHTSSEYYLATELARYAIAVEDVEVVGVKPELAVTQALIDGEVDAITIWEPATQFAKESLGDDLVAFRHDDAYFLRLGANTTADKLADPVKRAEIIAFIRQVVRASRELQERPERGAEIAARLSGFDEGLVLRSLATLEFVAHIEPDQLDVLVEQERWVAAEQGREPRTREELAPLIDTSAYEEALAGL